MSTKKTKYLGLILCCMLLCTCVIGLIKVAPKTYADDDVTAITLSELTTFTTTDGASIRTDTPTGIRFATSISQGEYNGLVKQYGSENLEFGMAIARVGSLEELKAADATKTLKPMSYWLAGAYPGSGAATYQYSFAIVALNESNYNRQYTTIGYVKVGDEIAYAKDANGQEFACTRTPLEVATTILATMPGDDNSYASEIVDTVMATGATLELQDASRPWGKETELDVTVNGNAVTPVYTVADPTVAKVEGNKLVGLKKGSTEVTATLNGKNADYTATATVTFTEKVIEPALNANGMLELCTEGEQTTISVYASDDTNCENALYTENVEAGTTDFDIHDSIISYKEGLNIKSDRGTTYTVKVQSENYIGVYASKEYMAVSNDTTSFPNHGKTQYAYAVTYGGENLYMYLTEDIDVTSSFGFNTWGNQVQVAMYLRDMDGRGHTISYTYDHNVTPNYFAGFAALSEGITWKNVHVVMNLTLAEGTNILSAFVGEAKLCKFENVYFEANVKNLRTTDAPLIRAGWGSELTNCIIELNTIDGSASGMVIRPFSGYTTFTNCAVIDSSSTEVPMGDEGGVSATNVYKYVSLADFIGGANGKVYNLTDDGFVTTDFDGKCFENWADAWEITETDVKLLGQTVRTTLKSEITPTLIDGMLALNTKGEQTAIKLYATDDTEFANVLKEDVTSAETYDIRDLILSYMEEQSASNGEYSYIVTVESDNYVGTYETETFVPVTQASEFVVMFNNAKATAQQYANKYYYLTNDIDISAYAARNTASFAQTCLGVYTYLSLDGRGHTITNTYEHTLESSNYVGLAGYMGHGSSGMVWRNVHYKANIALNSNKSAFGVFAFDLSGYTLYNCYIEANIMNNSSATTSVINLRGSHMYDCIIELNKASVSKSDVVILGKGEAVSGSINNCAIINSSSPNKITTVNGGENIIVNNCSTYGSFADYENDTSRYADWKYNWIESGSAEKQNVTPTFENGLLSLNTNGEFTTVKLYAVEDTTYTTVLATATAIKSIDVRDFVISYMEKQTLANAEYQYKVVIESEGYKGEYTTEKFIPITSASEFDALISDSADFNGTAAGFVGKFYYLTTDIDVSTYNTWSGWNQNGLGLNIQFSLDGRGHTISNVYTLGMANNYKYYGLAAYWGNGKVDGVAVKNVWKNVHYSVDLTVNENSAVRSIIGGAISNYDFYNCYFKVNYTDNNVYDSTVTDANTGLFSIDSSSKMYNCIIELNNHGTKKASVVGYGDTTGGSYVNVVVINGDVSSSSVVTAVPSKSAVANPVYGYTSIANFIAGNEGYNATGSNGATITAIENGTKCYSAWNSVWSITDGGISLCGQQIVTIA